MDRQDLGIYIHIPFCVQKCLYCDFLSFRAEDDIINSYVDKLCESIDFFGKELAEKYVVKTIYIGGGTPSSIKESYISRILWKLNSSFFLKPVEVTIEANPGTLNKRKLTEYRMAGVNRLSMGLQSANDEELKMLGRIHTFEDFERNFYEARNAGFRNISADLMTALPGQTESLLENSLNKLTMLEPEHISAYSLILEEGTYFYDHYEAHKDERKLYYLMKEYLENKGYARYEISNFSKPSKESRHNSSYWKGTDYLGLGLGASSLIDGRRLKNETKIKEYILNPNIMNVEEILTAESKMEEFMILGLRMSCGVKGTDFFDRFGISLEEKFGKEIEFLVNNGLLEVTDSGQDFCDIIRLTDKGTDHGNYVFSRFMGD